MEPMQLIPLASGSTANSTAIVDEGFVVIVDAGIKRTEILSRLAGLGVLTQEKPDPDALCLTHAHGDHARFAHQWPSKGTPVFATAKTLEKLGITGVAVEHWQTTVLDNVALTAAPVSHDCVDPVCWRVSGLTGTAVVATDLGCIPKSLMPIFQAATHLLLEANHHPRLLEACSRLQSIKARVAGERGHLSTDQACEFLRGMPESIKHVWLGHISQVANTPELVERFARIALDGRDVELMVVGQ